MADIKPFRGVTYNLGKVSKLADVTAPPYDVLSSADILNLHKQHPNNITHLTRPAGDNPYASAAALWKQWLSNGVLNLEDKSALYVYRQSFSDPETGQKISERLGIVCLLKLEDYGSGKVIPHENTISAHRADRLKLLQATAANLESIYGLYSDPTNEVAKLVKASGKLEAVIGDIGRQAGSTHRLDRITDAKVINKIAEQFKEKPIFIADGHHRYETSLAYREFANGNAEADYIVITLTAFEDPGLIVLPTHRLVRNVDTALIDKLPEYLLKAGFVSAPIELSRLKDVQPDPYGFIMIAGHRALAFKPSDPQATVDQIEGDKSFALKSLNVTILTQYALFGGLNIPADSLATTDHVTYTRDASEAISKARSHEVQAAFLLKRPTVQQVQDVAAASEKMPQKSTFFYPKLLSGLVMRDLTVK